MYHAYVRLDSAAIPSRKMGLFDAGQSPFGMEGISMGEKITDRLEKIVYGGKHIYYGDYKGLVGKELSSQIRDNLKARMEAAMSGDQEQLCVMDVRGCFATQKVLAAVQEAAVELAPYSKATAVVGVDELQAHLLLLVNRTSGIGAKPFDTVEKALEWVIRQP